MSESPKRSKGLDFPRRHARRYAVGLRGRDQRTGEIYFLANVEVPLEELARVPHVELYPGMPVDVAIVTGERTLFAYLAQPFTDSLAHAFRED